MIRPLSLMMIISMTVWGGLPARFELNRGQSPAEVRFVARGDGQSIFLTNRGATFHLAGAEAAIVDLHFDGMADGVTIEGDTRLPGIANYFRGDKPETWITNVPTFSRVRYKNVYPGIDMVFYTSGGDVEFDWVIAPGADPALIQFSLRGAGVPKLSGSGDLSVETVNGEFQLRAPVLYQSGKRVGGSYTLKNGKAGIVAGGYSRALTLVVDPVIAYHARIGPRQSGGGVGLLQGLNRGGAAIKVDAQGNAYVCGSTLIADFPVTPGVVQPVFGTPTGQLFTQNDIFITKLSPDGKNILYSTYLGGASEDVCLSMAIDAAGNAFVTGYTSSANFPVTSGAFQTKVKTGFYNGFAAKLSPNGNSLLYSTFISNEQSSEASGIVVDAGGNAYVAGNTFAGTLLSTPGAYTAPSGPSAFVNRAFVVKLNAAGSNLVFGSLLGLVSTSQGAAVPKEAIVSVAIDPDGNVYVAGTTGFAQPNVSVAYPVTDGAFQTKAGGGSDGFVSKLNADGSRLIYSTYLGGLGTDGVDSIAVDDQGQAVVTGHADSADFPVTGNALWPTPNAEFPPLRFRYPSYGFAAKLNAQGTGLIYSTYLGGGGSIVLSGVTLDAQNNIYIVGSHDAPNFPVSGDSTQHCIGNSNNWSNAVLMKLSPAGDKMLFSSYLGGNVRDQGLALAVDRLGAAYVTGMTDSTDFLPTPGAVSDPLGTTFITKIDMTVPAPNHLDCVVSAATMSSGAISPFEIVSIQGSGIGPKDTASTVVNKDGLIDTVILNTRVLFDGVAAPLVYVSSNRISAIVPETIRFRTATRIQVEQAGQLSNAITMPVTSFTPGLFTTSGSGIGQAAVINEDGTVNSASNPAARNTIVSFFGINMAGSTTLSGRQAGQVADKSITLGFVSIFIGGINVAPNYFGTVPGFTVSLQQLNARIPPNSQVGPRVPVYVSPAIGVAIQRTFIAVK